MINNQHIKITQKKKTRTATSLGNIRVQQKINKRKDLRIVTFTKKENKMEKRKDLSIVTNSFKDSFRTGSSQYMLYSPLQSETDPVEFALAVSLFSCSP